MGHRPAHADAHAPQQLAALIEAVPAITYACEWDEAATLRYISPQIEDVLGFVPGQLLADQDLWPLLAAILRLARAVDMEAVAEGVGSEAQRQFLVEQGCPFAQGFALGRPAPAAELRLPVA